MCVQCSPCVQTATFVDARVLCMRPSTPPPPPSDRLRWCCCRQGTSSKGQHGLTMEACLCSLGVVILNFKMQQPCSTTWIGRSKAAPLATDHLLENTDGVLHPPAPGGSDHPIRVLLGRQPARAVALPSSYADARYVDAGIVSKDCELRQRTCK